MAEQTNCMRMRLAELADHASPSGWQSIRDGGTCIAPFQLFPFKPQVPIERPWE